MDFLTFFWLNKIFNSRKNLEFYHFVKTLAKNTFLLPTVQFWAVLLTNWAKGGISRDVTTLARPCWVSLRQQAQGGRALAAVRSGGLYAVRRQLQIKIFWPDLNFFKKFGKLWRLQRISSVNVVIWRILAWKRVKKKIESNFCLLFDFFDCFKKFGKLWRLQRISPVNVVIWRILPCQTIESNFLFTFRLFWL